MMQIVHRETERASRLSIRGELDASSTEELERALATALDPLATALDQDPRSIELDLSALEFIDTVALGHVIRLFKRLRTEEGSLSITGLTGQPRVVFELLGLDRHFAVDTAA